MFSGMNTINYNSKESEQKLFPVQSKTMSSFQGQDVVRCQLCPNPVEHHCNLCLVDLCSSCIPTHMADRTKKHEVVEFISRKEGHILPLCSSHNKNRCEMYCRDCKEPTCVLCITSTHRKHDIADIGGIVENIKHRIYADLAELENDIAPAFRNVMAGVPSAEFDNVLSAIKDQEDAICKVVRDMGSKMREEVTKQKNQSMENKETELLAASTEKELNGNILYSRNILKSSDVTAIMNYESRNEIFRDIFNKLELFYRNFLPGRIRNEQIYEMFGGIQMHRITKPLNLFKSPGTTGHASTTPSFNFGTPRNACSAFGIQPSGSSMGFGVIQRKELFGSSNNAGSGFTFEKSTQSPNLFGSSSSVGFGGRQSESLFGSNAGTGFSFGCHQSPSSGFSFGCHQSPSSGFSFGCHQSPSSGFSFGCHQSPSSGFSFGCHQSPSSGFSFGCHQSPSSGFSFGNANCK